MDSCISGLKAFRLAFCSLTGFPAPPTLYKPPFPMIFRAFSANIDADVCKMRLCEGGNQPISTLDLVVLPRDSPADSTRIVIAVVAVLIDYKPTRAY